MMSIRTTLLIAGATALLGATAASAQPANRGAHNSDATHGLRSTTTMLGDASIEGVSERGADYAKAAARPSEKALAVAAVSARSAAR